MSHGVANPSPYGVVGLPANTSVQTFATMSSTTPANMTPRHHEPLANSGLHPRPPIVSASSSGPDYGFCIPGPEVQVILNRIEALGGTTQTVFPPPPRDSIGGSSAQSGATGRTAGSHSRSTSVDEATHPIVPQWAANPTLCLSQDGGNPVPRRLVGSMTTMEGSLGHVPRHQLEQTLVEVHLGLQALVAKYREQATSAGGTGTTSTPSPLNLGQEFASGSQLDPWGAFGQSVQSVAPSRAASARASKTNSPNALALDPSAGSIFLRQRFSLQPDLAVSRLGSVNFGSGTFYGGNYSSFHEFHNLIADEDMVGNNIINDYTLVAEIGKGACGAVKLAVHNTNPSELYAIKVVKKSLLRASRNAAGAGAVTSSGTGSSTPGELSGSQASPFQQAAVAAAAVASRRQSMVPATTALARKLESSCHEVAIMKKLRHRNIVTLHAVIDDPASNEMFLIMDYIPNGTLLKEESKNEETEEVNYITIPERRVKRYLPQLIDGLRYLHKHGIVHRDLKPENILLGENQHVYIADFGVAEMLAPEEALDVTGTVGTPLYWPPEMFSATAETWNGAAQDCWALGCTLYTMIYGKHPFFGVGYFALKKAICSTEPLVVPESPTISSHLKDLLKKMLSKDPAGRLSLQQMREHPFLAGVCRPPPSVAVVQVTDLECQNAIVEGRNIHPQQRSLLLHSRQIVRRYVAYIRDKVGQRKAKEKDEESPQPQHQKESRVPQGCSPPTVLVPARSSADPLPSVQNSSDLSSADQFTSTLDIGSPPSLCDTTAYFRSTDDSAASASISVEKTTAVLPTALSAGAPTVTLGSSGMSSFDSTGSFPRGSSSRRNSSGSGIFVIDESSGDIVNTATKQVTRLRRASADPSSTTPTPRVPVKEGTTSNKQQGPEERSSNRSSVVTTSSSTHSMTGSNTTGASGTGSTGSLLGVASAPSIVSRTDSLDRAPPGTEASSLAASSIGTAACAPNAPPTQLLCTTASPAASTSPPLSSETDESPPVVPGTPPPGVSISPLTISQSLTPLQPITSPQKPAPSSNKTDSNELEGEGSRLPAPHHLLEISNNSLDDRSCSAPTTTRGESTSTSPRTSSFTLQLGMLRSQSGTRKSNTARPSSPDGDSSRVLSPVEALPSVTRGGGTGIITSPPPTPNSGSGSNYRIQQLLNSPTNSSFGSNSGAGPATTTGNKSPLHHTSRGSSSGGRARHFWPNRRRVGPIASPGPGSRPTSSLSRSGDE